MLTFGVKAPDFARTKQLLAHIPGAAEKAMSRAINRAIASAKTEAVKGAKERYTISDTELRRGIKVVMASPQRLRATLVATSAWREIVKFKVSKGPFVEVIKGSGKRFPYSFLSRVTGPKGGTHYGLWAREKEFTIPKEGRYAKKKQKEGSKGTSRSAVGDRMKRQNIAEVLTVSNPEMLGHYEVIERTLELAGEKLETELARQVDLFLSGKVK